MDDFYISLSNYIETKKLLTCKELKRNFYNNFKLWPWKNRL